MIERVGRAMIAVVMVVLLTTASGLGTSAGVAQAASPVKNVSLQVGATSTVHHLSWYARAVSGQSVQVMQRPADGRWSGPARTVPARAHRTSERGWVGLRAVVAGLEAGRTYLYRVGSGRGGWSSTGTFTVPAGDHGTFIALGDPQLAHRGRSVRGADGWRRTVESATTRHPRARFLLSLGDQVNDPRSVSEWDAFYAPTRLRGYRLATVPGNHDVARRSTTYGEHVHLPGLAPAGRTVAGTGDYHFVDGATLVVGLNSNEKRVEVHRDHLRRVVAANPARWIVVVMHHAPFSGAGHLHDADVRAFRARLTPEFSRLGVDLVLSGHDHSYVRTHLMTGAAVSHRTGPAPATVRPGPREVMYLTLDSSSGSKHYALEGKVPWAAVRHQGMRPSYTAVTTSPTSLVATTYDDRGALVDSVTLQR